MNVTCKIIRRNLNVSRHFLPPLYIPSSPIMNVYRKVIKLIDYFLYAAIYWAGERERVIREKHEFGMRRWSSRRKRTQFAFCFIDTERERIRHMKKKKRKREGLRYINIRDFKRIYDRKRARHEKNNTNTERKISYIFQ